MARTRVPDGRRWLRFDKGYNKNISKHFKASEFACKCPNSGNTKCQEDPCNCTEIPIDPQLVAILESIREHFGKPVQIYSGYRCNTHNSHVSNAASNSRHRAWDGYSETSSEGVQAAVDMGISGVTPHEIAQYAERIGVNGIGKYSDFVHLDTRLTKSFWLGHEQERVPGDTFGTPKEYIKENLPTYRLTSDNTYIITDGDETDSVVTTSKEVEFTLPEEPTADFTGLHYNSSNKPRICWQSKSSCFTGTTLMDIKGIVIHSSESSGDTISTYVQPSNDSNDRDDMLSLIGHNNTFSDWNHRTSQEGYNACIGKLADGSVSSVQVMPWSYRAWGCGLGVQGTCNDGWIQLFVCMNNSSDSNYFQDVYSELCNLIAYLCRMYKLNPKGTTWCGGVSVPVLLSHTEAFHLGVASYAQEIQNWFTLHSKSMASLREEVYAILNGVDAPKIPQGSLVKLKPTAISRDGSFVNSWMLNKKWFVEISNDGDLYCLLGEFEQSSSLKLNKWFMKKDLDIASATVAVETPPIKVDETTVEGFIWSTLVTHVFDNGKTITPEGAAGIMGNLFAESGLKSNNMQNDYESSVTGRTGSEADEWYTAAVDAGTYENFVEDAVGYGIAQWTYYSRKAGLLQHVQSKQVSISDLDAQLEYLLIELSNNQSIVDVITNTDSTLEETSDIILKEFENPADQSDSVVRRRREFGSHYLEKFTGYNACKHMNTSIVDAILPTCLQEGYSGDTVCTDCGKILNYGSILPRTEHDFDWRGICRNCKLVNETFTPDELISKDDLQEILQVLYNMLER